MPYPTWMHWNFSDMPISSGYGSASLSNKHVYNCWQPLSPNLYAFCSARLEIVTTIYARLCQVILNNWGSHVYIFYPACSFPCRTWEPWRYLLMRRICHRVLPNKTDWVRPTWTSSWKPSKTSSCVLVQVYLMLSNVNPLFLGGSWMVWAVGLSLQHPYNVCSEAITTLYVCVLFFWGRYLSLHISVYIQL